LILSRYSSEQNTIAISPETNPSDKTNDLINGFNWRDLINFGFTTSTLFKDIIY